MEEKISYDSKEDILYYNRGSNVQDSLDIGNVFLEFSSEGDIVGIEILEASETISDITGEDFTPQELSRITEAEIKTLVNGGFAFVTLFFFTEKEGEKVRERVNVNVPTSAVA